MSWWHSLSKQEAAAEARGRWPIVGFNGLLPAQLLSDPSVTPFAKIVYAAICWQTNIYNGPQRTSHSQLATFLHASTDGVYQATRALRRSGWCSVRRSGRESVYELHSERQRTVTGPQHSAPSRIPHSAFRNPQSGR